MVCLHRAATLPRGAQTDNALGGAILVKIW
jgi:hypothetical protein